MKLKPTKCTFFQEQVHYLGHVISREGVTPGDDRKSPKRCFLASSNSTPKVQQFLGFANYYRRFIRDFSTNAKPLHHLTERGVTFKWNDACQSAFEELCTCLSTPSILAFPDFPREFILDMDASDCGIGGVYFHKWMTMDLWQSYSE